MKRYLISLSILSADFARLGEDIMKALLAGADMIHFDVMDNHYVPNLTIGPMVLKSLRSYGITAPIDVHLMIRPVDRIIPDFAEAGASMITFHPEASEQVDHTIKLIKEHGCQAGLAFNLTTSLNFLNCHILEKLNSVLIMSVNPGFSGQSFIPYALKKLNEARKRIDESNDTILLAIDGGVNTENIEKIAKIGADMFVVGSAIFNTLNYNKVIKNMRNALEKINYTVDCK